MGITTTGRPQIGHSALGFAGRAGAGFQSHDHALPMGRYCHRAGAIWVADRPDLPADRLAVLRRLARVAGTCSVRWDERLSAPAVGVVVRRQLKLESADDPRLLQFAETFSGRSPEPNVPC